MGLMRALVLLIMLFSVMFTKRFLFTITVYS